MKALRYLVLAGALTAAGVLATATGAAAAPGAHAPKRTVEQMHAHVDDMAKHINDHLTELRPKIAANKRLTAAQRSQLNADIAAVLTAVAAVQKEIKADTTLAQINEDRPLLAALRDKRAKLRTDLAAVRPRR